MLYREIIAVCSQIHIKHINTLCELNVKLAVHIVTTASCSVNPFTSRQQTKRWGHSSGDNGRCSQGCITDTKVCV